MNKNRDFKAKMTPEAKIWNVAFFIILMSKLYTIFFLFIVIGFNQYFGVENPKCARKTDKMNKNHDFKAKMAPEAKIRTVAFFIILMF